MIFSRDNRRWRKQRQVKDMGQKINFVTGKGGVGKSVFAAALALAKSQTQEKVLLVEIGENSYYQDFFGLPQVNHEPVATGLGFDVALWSGETCLREYILYYLKLEKILSLFFENTVMKSLINVAPGLNEIAILGKITSGVRKVGPALNYDRIVVDCYATGHAMALFRAPRGMMEAIRFGPMGRHSTDMYQTIRNPEICAYHIVTLLEEMPVVESLELAKSIFEEVGIKPQLFSNKTLHPPVGIAELEKMSGGVAEFATFLKASLERQEKYLSELLQATHQNAISDLPLVFSNDAKSIVKKCAEQEFIRTL